MDASHPIRQMLESQQIAYQVLEHPIAFTALEIAEAQHIPGREVVKAVIVKIDGKLAMCVLPAIHKIGFPKLLQALHAKKGELVSEGLIAQLFPEYEVGAMPPFGDLAGLMVYLDKSLEENEQIVFNAGSHMEVIQIKYKDYIRLLNPVILDFGVHI